MSKKLAVLHHRHADWVPALREAAPDLDIRGWHPRDWEASDAGWLADAGALFCWKIPRGFLTRMPHLAWVQNSGAGVDHLLGDPAIPPHIPITHRIRLQLRGKGPLRGICQGGASFVVACRWSSSWYAIARPCGQCTMRQWTHRRFVPCRRG